MARRNAPEINAGSMADIAFLLLIFFLVTTTMDVDSGIAKKLPEKPPKNMPPPKIKERNILEVNLNKNNELMIRNERVTLKDVKELVKAFIDNGGGIGNAKEGEKEGKPCDYCKGKKDPKSSDHPSKAVISVQTNRVTNYGVYMSVQNEILKAYSELRNRLCKERYGVSFSELEAEFKDKPKNNDLKKKVKDIKDSYPQILSDAEPTSN